jgi:hypothetical protein
VLRDTAFPDPIQRQIDAIDAPSLVILSTTVEDWFYAKLLVYERFDFVIAYPVDIIAYEQEFETKLNIRSYGIKNTERFALGHFMCNKAAYKMGFVDTLDSIIKKQTINGTTEDVFLSFFEAEQAEPLFQFFEKKVIGTNQTKP